MFVVISISVCLRLLTVALGFRLGWRRQNSGLIIYIVLNLVYNRDFLLYGSIWAIILLEKRDSFHYRCTPFEPSPPFRALERKQNDHFFKVSQPLQCNYWSINILQCRNTRSALISKESGNQRFNFYTAREKLFGFPWWYHSYFIILFIKHF